MNSIFDATYPFTRFVRISDLNSKIRNAKISIRIWHESWKSWLERRGAWEREAWAKNHETGWKANGRGATSAASLYWSKWYRHKGTRGSFVNSILTSGVCRRQLLFRRNKLPRTAAALCHALSTRPALHDRYFNAPSPTLSMRVFQFRSFYSCERSSPLKSSVKTCVSRFFFSIPFDRSLSVFLFFFLIRFE